MTTTALITSMGFIPSTSNHGYRSQAQMTTFTKSKLRIIHAVSVAEQPYAIWERLKALDDALVEINAMRRELMTMQKGEAGMAGKRNGKEGDI